MTHNVSHCQAHVCWYETTATADTSLLVISPASRGGPLKSVYRSVSVVCLCGLVLFAVQCGSDSSSPIQIPPPGHCSSTTNPSQVLTSSPAIVPLVKLSADTFTNATSQHATEVEPDSYSWGQTIIAAFQVGRISGGGAADIGYAISTDAGATWQNGLLPGLTTLECLGKNSAVSDTAVVYDAAHTTWLIASLPISSANIQVAVNRSADGGATWSNPVIVANGANLDKNWITCDNTATSPFYGHCYAEWDDNGNGNLIFMSNSTDGGATWSPQVSTSANANGLGAEPLVQPDGTVIVPYLANAPFIESFSSTDGGASW